MDISWVLNEEARAMTLGEFPNLVVNISVAVVVGIAAVAAWMSLRPKQQ